MFVGEQPGDQEDRLGHPFVGPAGQLLDEALLEAKIDRKEVYVTNVVKHFKWEADSVASAGFTRSRAQRKCRRAALARCRVATVRPQVVVCLGATAAQTLLGKDFRVTRDRGTFVKSNLAPQVMATAHPSSILRATDSEQREQQRQEFVRDLKKVAELLLQKVA